MVDYCISLFQKKQRAELIVCYKAECLRMISENTAKMVTEGKYVEQRLIDLLDDLGKPPKKELTADEVIERMKKKMNGE